MDNGSTDGTKNVAIMQDASVMDVGHLVGKPKVIQYALQTIDFSDVDRVIICDADGQHPVACVSEMMLTHTLGRISKGTRFTDQAQMDDIPRERIMLQQKSNDFFQNNYGVAYTDPQCGLICMDSKLVPDILAHLQFDGPSWELELLVWLCAHNRESMIQEKPIPPVYQLSEQKQQKKYSDDDAATREREQRIVDHLEFLKTCRARFA
jgi:glycosyltransferase involved in cell wall biosynthesis